MRNTRNELVPCRAKMEEYEGGKGMKKRENAQKGGRRRARSSGVEERIEKWW